jgi:nucleoside-diphosphate-sugar epimerase
VGRVSGVAFVAGATGFTGRAVVAALRAGGRPTVAHVRPASPRLEEWRRRFEALGATVDTTPWEPEAFRDTLAKVAPAQVYALLGTTRKRASREGKTAVEGYEAVDYGLTKILLDAASGVSPPPRFVYLSSVGVSPGVRNPYLAARAKVEAALRLSGVPCVIARPAIITGAGRDDGRLMERVGASFGDAALGLAGLLGGSRLRQRYGSTTNDILAQALIRLADSAQHSVIVAEGADLR